MNTKTLLATAILAFSIPGFSQNPGTATESQVGTLETQVAQLQALVDRLLASNFLLFNTNYAPLSTCSNSTNPSCLIFTTAATMLGNMTIMYNNQYKISQPSTSGITAANSICQQEGDARFGAGRTWKAWLSDSTQEAGTAVYQSTKQYVNIFGATIAAPGELLSSSTDPLIPVLINSISNGLPGSWTGTTPDGKRTAANCNDWSDISDTFRADGGGSDTTDTGWTMNFFEPGNLPCNSRLYRALYCVEQG